MDAGGTPLFTALTRQPELAGIPVSFWGVGATIPCVLWVVLQSWWVWVTPFMLYPLLRYFAKKDPYFFTVWRISQFKTKGTKNRAFWGGNSYGA